MIKFSEVWYVNVSQQKKIQQKNFFSILAFFGFFWPFLSKKRPKLTNNEENWQNSNRLMKFSEIWYVDASQQKNSFWISAFFGRFLTKKQPKLTINEENWQNLNR